ncbi:MAG: hypothetical protein JRH07_19270 [Deltaproteobacteria bacterium]|nr:hypothetical protein [Deltaproteobacteria bacterium]
MRSFEDVVTSIPLTQEALTNELVKIAPQIHTNPTEAWEIPVFLRLAGMVALKNPGFNAWLKKLDGKLLLYLALAVSKTSLLAYHIGYRQALDDFQISMKETH